MLSFLRDRTAYKALCRWDISESALLLTDKATGKVLVSVDLGDKVKVSFVSSANTNNVNYEDFQSVLRDEFFESMALDVREFESLWIDLFDF